MQSRYGYFGASFHDVSRRLPRDLTVSPVMIDAALCDAEAHVEAFLPDRYRKLLSRVEGEVLVFCATEGQISAAIGLPAATNLVLYGNVRGPFSYRRAADQLPSSSYSLSETGDVVLFSVGMLPGTRIIADYNTSLGDGVRVLAHLVATLAAGQIAGAIMVGQPAVSETLLGEAEKRLASLAAGLCGVPEFDALRFVDDWERGPRGIRTGYLDRN